MRENADRSYAEVVLSYMMQTPFISSPELKAQVSFSNSLLSVVRLSLRPPVRPSVCKHFTSPSKKALGQFQLNLA